MSHPLCIDAPGLTRFLESRLPPAEESAVIGHLDTCPDCRGRLEHLAAAADEWQRVADCLGDPLAGELAGEAFAHPLAVTGRDEPWEFLESSADGKGGPAVDAPDPIADVLNILAPTDDPRMLGRLGRYEVVGVIGQGGMGVVLKGYDRPLNRFVAVKLLAPALATSGAYRQRFAREARAAAAVIHEHVIAIHNVSEFRGLPYLVMPYLGGPSLQRRIERTGALGVVEVLRIARQVALGLAAAHEQGLVHRDVKPSNILLESDVERVTITDFGLARAIDDVSITQTGVIPGTPQYMSPEQARGEAIDHRSDLFSLGSVIYAMGTGTVPFPGGTAMAVLRNVCESDPRPMRQFNAEIPAWLEDVVAKLHRKAPEERFQSADEVAGLLESCLAHLQQPTTIPPPRVEISPAAARPAGRRWLWAGAAAVLLTCAAVAGWRALLGPPAGAGLPGPASEAAAAAAPSNPAPGGAPEAAVGLMFRQQHVSIPPLPEQVRAVDFSGDGRLLAVGHSNQNDHQPTKGTGSVYVWDVERRKTVATHLEPAGVVKVALSPDGSLLAYSTLASEVKVFDLATGRQVHGAKNPQGSAAVAFSPDGRLLAVVPAGRNVELWDVATWTRREVQFAGEPRFTVGVAFSPDGKLVATGGGVFPPEKITGHAAVWDVETGRRVISVAQSAPVMAVDFTPDGKNLATACLDTYLRLWDLTSGEAVRSYRDPETGLTGLCFLDGGATVATLGPRSGVKLFDAAADTPHTRLRFGTALTFAVDAAPDGRLIASGGQDRVVRLWDGPKHELVAALQPGLEAEIPLAPILSVAASPDEKVAALGREDGTIVLRDVATGTYLRTLTGHEDQVTALAFTPDGKSLISGSYDNTVRVWDYGTGETRRTLEGHTNWVMSLAVSPDSSRLASGSYDRTVRLWDLSSGETVAGWEAHTASVRAVAFSPDGSRLLSAGSDRLAKVWDPHTRELLLTCDAHKRPIRAAAFAPDGETVATGSEDGKIVLWNAKTGLDRRTLAGHTGMVWCLAFSGDGEALVSGGDDRTVRVWDVARQQPRQALPAHQDAITSLALLPEKGTLISAGLDQTVKLWSPRTDAPPKE